MMDSLVRPLSLGKKVWLSEVGQALLYQRVLSAFQAFIKANP
jgi:hypothetical protein